MALTVVEEAKPKPEAFKEPPEREAIESGSITIDGEPATVDSIIKNGQIVSHTLHRHEPPVTSLPIKIVHEDDDIIVIDKPAGIPVHPAGRYNYNSVVEMMRAERGHGWNPLPCNRLDRLTSGIMFIGKHPKAAEEMAESLRARTVQKEYIARVKGYFPDGVVLCDQPMLKVSPVLGLNRVRASGKEATTKFRRVAYYPPVKKADKPDATPSTGADVESATSPNPEVRAATPPPPPADIDEGYSIVHCLPLTGRTHQIRVHLQFLGHPITNDPIYSNRRVFGTNLGKSESTGENDEEIIARLSRMGKTEPADSLSYQTFQTPPPERVTNGGDPNVVNELLAREHDVMINDYLRRKGEKMNGEHCDICGTELYSDPGVHELGIFLHAVAYSDLTGRWKYKSQMPSWAMPPDGVDGPKVAPEWVEDKDGAVVIGKGMMEDDETALVQGLGTLNLTKLAQESSNADLAAATA
ncbi:pseudouridine synthase [Arthroderma uncinatum]|uniref:pseudouridine synthase n=1 Tax=Arthroderma uncinatum TaxID=74035 RepID=UPI00144AA977|nr:pseudouridine synthase [Arthroderma uncinatum]KAF3483278.1 pseudouridine synthase [Arthroderma uncinatum]